MSWRRRKRRRRFVVCELCGKSLKKIGLHLTAVHKTTTTSYLKQFPSARLASYEQRDSARQRKIADWTNEVYREKGLTAAEKGRLSSTRLDPDYRRHHSESQSIAMRKHWAKPGSREEHSKRQREWGSTAKFKSKMKEVNKSNYEHLSSETKERLRLGASIRTKELWGDPEYRKKVRGRRKWWGSEITFRDAVLKPMGLWGSGNRLRFYGHVDIPSKHHKGFSFNADFANKKLHLIIHVDGPTHYDPGFKGHYQNKSFAKTMARDVEIDNWCLENGWRFLRITDQDIRDRPGYCRNVIERFIKGGI